VCDTQESQGAEEESAEKKEVEEEAKPDPLNQLITALSRGAQEQQSALPEDDLYISYAEIMSLVRFNNNLMLKEKINKNTLELWQYIFIILKKTSLHKTMKCNEYSFEV
jgi:hypothetical protein